MLTSKTLTLNKFIVDLMVQEEIIKSLSCLFKINKPELNVSDITEYKKRLENIINVLLEEKLTHRLSDSETRLNSLEAITQSHSKDIDGMKSDIKMMQTDLSLFKESSSNNHNVTHKLLILIINRLPSQMPTLQAEQATNSL
ncbi:unnamed protein product [Brachionus calyciflorus]|uniref:Uncharacterized protein n=1 Tax=Brachionus calyciflorus TaxID=104777 RepID=A0A814B610_9BILA|nr:unnamed protein product [Brachionus calyciflorus]